MIQELGHMNDEDEVLIYIYIYMRERPCSRTKQFHFSNSFFTSQEAHTYIYNVSERVCICNVDIRGDDDDRTR